MQNDPRVERRLDVLRSVVRTYIALGEPVGSKTVAGTPGCEVSPATVRAVMAELEEMGYLSQPHASAGRVPTDRGYRAYVDLVLAERRAPDAAATLVRPEPQERGESLSDFLLETSRSLSRMCGCIGLVLRPRLAQTRFVNAHFLRLDRHRVVAVIIGEQGVLTDEVVHVDEDYAQEDLDRISNYVVNRFQGSTFHEVRKALERELYAEKAAVDAALRQWLRLAHACLAKCAAAQEVYAEGAAQCVESADFADIDRVRRLLHAYEEKGRIVRLLANCLGREGVQIHIGTEGPEGAGLEGLPGLAFVASSYGESGSPLGSVGVLGPTRLDYEKVIAVVDRVARDVGAVLLAGTRTTDEPRKRDLHG